MTPSTGVMVSIAGPVCMSTHTVAVVLVIGRTAPPADTVTSITMGCVLSHLHCKLLEKEELFLQ